MTEIPPPADAVHNHALDEDERAELIRLRAEVAALRAAPAEPLGRRPRRLPTWRTTVATLLIVVGCVLAPISVVAVWARNQATNTDRYVENVAPLASEPNVQAAISDRITNEIFTHVDVQALVNQAVAALAAQGVPAQVTTALGGLAGSIESGARGFVHDRVDSFVTSETFQALWVDANRIGHQAFVALLSGETDGTVTVEGGAVQVDLAEFIEAVKRNLINSGFTIVERVPEVHPQFTILQSDDLTRAQTGFRALDRLGTVLPFITLGFLATGVYVGRGHRRALVWAGMGVALSMLVLALALAVARTLYLDQLPDTISAPAAADVFDTLVRFLRTGLRTVFAAALVIAIGAFFTGPSTTAVRTRSALTAGISRLRRFGESAGLRTGPVGAWSYRNRRFLRGGVVAGAALLLVFWDRPTGKAVVLIAVLALIALAIVEFLARPPATVERRELARPEFSWRES